MPPRKRVGRSSGSAEAPLDAAAGEDGTPQKKDPWYEEPRKEEPPLKPTSCSWRAVLLFFNRAGRCALVSLVPIVGIGWALPRVLALQRAAPLCTSKRSWKPGVPIIVSCSGAAIDEGPDLRSDWYHYAFTVWISIQFVYNFAESCFREPGLVPLASDNTLDGTSLDKQGRFAVRFSDGLDKSKLSNQVALWYHPRWCQYCNSWKPPRAHHSKKFGRCIFRMDHYCVVTENLIGARNHGHFVLMVLFGDSGLCYALVMMLYTMVILWEPYWNIHRRMAAIASSRDQFWYWHATGGNIHVLKALIGGELPTFIFLFTVAVLLIGPLIKQVSFALRGDTVLETQSDINDCIEIPGVSKVLALPLAAYTRGSRLQNLRLLLGKWWFLRMLVPCRGAIDASEQLAPTLSYVQSEAILELFEEEK